MLFECVMLMGDIKYYNNHQESEIAVDNSKMVYSEGVVTAEKLGFKEWTK